MRLSRYQKRADTNRQDSKGQTAGSIAKEKGFQEVFQELESHQP